MFANRLRKELERSGLQQKELAEKLNVSPATIHFYLKARMEPGIAALLKMSEIFSCSVDYLLCKTDVREADTPEIQIDDNEIRSLIKKISDAVNAAEREGVITAEEKILFFNEAMEQIKFKLWNKEKKSDDEGV